MNEEAEKSRMISSFRSGPLQVGEKVRIKANGMVGEVSIVSDKAVTVIIGNIKSKMPLDKVERITSNEYKSAVKAAPKPVTQTTSMDSSISERKLNFKMELDVRGQRVNEALDNVMHYIDDAIMLNVSSVRIIHGKGTGLLRKAVHQRLKQLKYVKSFRLGVFGEGEDGVTIVTLA